MEGTITKIGFRTTTITAGAFFDVRIEQIDETTLGDEDRPDEPFVVDEE